MCRNCIAAPFILHAKHENGETSEQKIGALSNSFAPLMKCNDQPHSAKCNSPLGLHHQYNYNRQNTKMTTLTIRFHVPRYLYWSDSMSGSLTAANFQWYWIVIESASEDSLSSIDIVDLRPPSVTLWLTLNSYGKVRARKSVLHRLMECPQENSGVKRYRTRRDHFQAPLCAQRWPLEIRRKIATFRRYQKNAAS